MTCPDERALAACFDGELDAATAASVRAHAAQCARCGAELEALAAIRSGARQVFGARVPESLRLRVASALDAEDATRRVPARAGVGLPAPAAATPPLGRWRVGTFWWGAAAGALTAVVTLFAVLAATGRGPIGLNSTAPLDALTADHVGALRSGRLIEVVSTDRHTVKPWFAGRADVSPVVADFRDRGYALIGGRTDELAGQRAAVTVYRHERHLIDVFSWQRRSAPPEAEATRRGYRIACWVVADVQYCAISDTGWDELHGLVRLLRDESLADESRH